ncbi:MAG TPA: tRNA pseudouridine(55) synthase TruB [Fibrobacteria bacterium]|nr:tRNA pseudouridine(55) synthase TruB [Fibrobacteria bacterium]
MTSANAHGILLLNKPPGISSFAALFPVKRAFGGRKGAKVGHAGTLDPAASGLLVVGVGAGTRLLEFLEAMPKRYSFRLNLGIVTDSYDLEGAVLERHDASHITRADLEARLEEFRGEISQTPPAYSAIKIDGKRAYERARAGETVTLTSRRVHIHRLEILSFGPDDIVLEVDCSKGTYVRSLAHDLGRVLGCGAAADRIRRLRIGPFRVEDAVPVKPEADNTDGTRFRDALLPLETATADLPALRVPDAALPALRNGNALPAEAYAVTKAAPPGAPADTEYAVHSERGTLLGTATRDDGILHPRKVFPSVRSDAP